MKPVTIGVVLAAVIVAGGFLAPALLPPAMGPKTLQALRDAELGRRELHAYDPTLPLAAERSDLATLKQADLEPLLAETPERFDELHKQSSERVNQAKRADRENRMPESGLQPFAASPAGIRTALGDFDKQVRENQKLLTDAAKNASAAEQADRSALGVGQIAGAVKLAEASRLLAEARDLNASLTSLESKAFAKASEWAEAQSERDYFAGLDSASVRQVLDADAEELGAALTKAQAEAQRLTAAVAEREQKLQEVRSELEQARTERLSLEAAGFALGDDASFDAYRDKYLRLSRRMGELQEQEQLLAFGGIEDGQPEGDDMLAGELKGQEILGLDELKSRLAIAQENVKRYTNGQQALSAQARRVDTWGQEAQARAAQYASRLETLAADVAQLRDEITQKARQASEKEDAALAAARAAVTAFSGAKSAVDQWMQQAGTLQREKDPQRTNERLRQIVNDKFAVSFATNAEARAKTVVGRIQTERALAIAAQLDTLRRISKLLPEAEFDATELESAFNTARDEAVRVLNEAREMYERLAQQQSNTSWVHQASLAAVYHLLWQIDAFNAAQHRSDLIDQLGRVVSGRQQSPRLAEEVKLYDVVTAGARPAPASQKAPESPGEQPPDEDSGQ